MISLGRSCFFFNGNFFSEMKFKIINPNPNDFVGISRIGRQIQI